MATLNATVERTAEENEINDNDKMFSNVTESLSELITRIFSWSVSKYISPYVLI